MTASRALNLILAVSATRLRLAIGCGGLLIGGCTEQVGAAQSARDTTVGQRVPYDFAVPLPSVPPLAVGDAELGVTARDCGGCHTEIYEEWRGSTHAAAMRDPQYYAELSKPRSPRWLCLSCHAPVQNQRRGLITAETRLRDDPRSVAPIEHTPNPTYDPDMQREGVTCATCHVRAEAGASYVVAAHPSGRAPHPVRDDAAALRGICQRCHEPGTGRVTPVFLCWFETATEGERRGVEKDCVDCHMPPVTRSIVAGGPKRSNRHHYWTGGGVPKTFAGYDALLNRAYQPGLTLEPHLEGDTLTIALTNRFAGHHVTSADPERFIWVRTAVEDRAGRRTVVDARRIGQTWDWGQLYPEVRDARRVADDRIPAGASKRWTVTLPPRAKVTVSAAHVRLTPANARHMKRTAIDPALLEIWPEASERVANLEDNYPMMTWFARATTKDGRTWRHAPLGALIKESKALQGSALETYETILEPVGADDNGDRGGR